jgi:hypothetical protein
MTRAIVAITLLLLFTTRRRLVEHYGQFWRTQPFCAASHSL